MGQRGLRVLVVGDDPLARSGLVFLLAGESELRIVEQVDTAAAAAAIQRDEPDLAIWDLGVDSELPLERLGELGEAAPPVLVLLADEQAASDALAAGARGLLFRDAEPRRIAAAAAAIAGGLLVFDEPLGTVLLRPRAAAAPLAEPLTPRELEVLQLLAEGLSNRLIADRLGISEHTAKFHITAIVGKLGAQSRTDAAIRGARLGLILL
ncbi:MAG TPA: response regulator transcription factor [Thermoanaerobaculia bacterium]|nr:response regulator transcription factor [Thermoanaerobaculia bacterium]